MSTYNLFYEELTKSILHLSLNTHFNQLKLQHFNVVLTKATFYFSSFQADNLDLNCPSGDGGFIFADFVVDDEGGRVNDVEGRVIPVEGLLSASFDLVTIKLGDFLPLTCAGAETARLSLFVSSWYLDFG